MLNLQQKPLAQFLIYKILIETCVQKSLATRLDWARTWPVRAIFGDLS